MAGAGQKKKPTFQDFLTSLQALERDLRDKIQAEVEGFPDDASAAADRRARVQTDFGYFCDTYFPHYVKGKPSAFHSFLRTRLPEIAVGPGGARDVIAAPRGNAKSTYVSLLYVIWVLLTRRKRFPVVLSDTLEQAAVHLAALKAEVEFNPRLNQDFPNFTGAGPVWQATEVVLKIGAKVKIGGSSKALRGFRHGAQRPDLVVCDDLENDENVRKPEQRAKLESWIDKTVEPLGPPDGSMDLIWVNTFLHHDAVAVRKSRNPGWRATVFKAVVRFPDCMDLWDKWEDIYLNLGEPAADSFFAASMTAMLAGAEVLWPEVQPFYRLMKIRVRVGRDAFSSEYQNEPISGEDQPFGRITFWVSRLAEWIFFGVCDPSLGKANARNDPSAILVGGLNRETGILDVVEADIRKRLPDRIIEDIIAMQAAYLCLKFGVETVQFQEFLRTELVKRSAKRGIPVPAVAIPNHADKALRIESIQPHVQNGLIRLAANQATLLEQLRYWPQADHDDGPDALEMLWRIATGGFSCGQPRTSGARIGRRGSINDYIGG
ncbi:MAG: phage terminase large subunit [Rhodospirillaceae bacterium]|nr:phage terminase large subunit [Rhodospirillaceae bacterium]